MHLQNGGAFMQPWEIKEVDAESSFEAYSYFFNIGFFSIFLSRLFF